MGIVLALVQCARSKTLTVGLSEEPGLLGRARMVNYDGITALLLQVVPELGPKYLQFVIEKERTRGVGDLPPDIVCAEMLVPFLGKLLAGTPTDGAKMLVSRIFAFLEQLSVSSDEEIRLLVEQSVCRRLVDDHGAHRPALPFMGPNMREIVEAMVGAKRILNNPQGRPPGAAPKA